MAAPPRARRAVAALLLAVSAACTSSQQAVAPTPSRPYVLPTGLVQVSPDPGVLDPPRWPPPAPWTIVPTVYVPVSPDPNATPLTTPSPQPPPQPGNHPAGSVFESLAHGYDISYPQCGSDTRPAGARFGIVGVNAGLAFTLNRCFMAQWLATTVPSGIYLNSGYNPGNAHRVLPECAAQAAALTPDPGRRLAYGLGCSTARDTLGALHAVGIQTPATWWIDVESGNSWDDTDQNLNHFSLQGEVDQLTPLGAPVGVYASFRDWGQIMGDWSYAGITANWVAGRPPDKGCSLPGFSGAPVWLVQEGATWQDASGLDSNYAC